MSKETSDKRHLSVMGQQRLCLGRSGSFAIFTTLSALFCTFIGVEWLLGSLSLISLIVNLGLAALFGACAIYSWIMVRGGCPSCLVWPQCRVVIRRRWR